MNSTDSDKASLGQIKNTRIELTEEQRLDWLQLSRSANVGPVLFRNLINRFSNAKTAIQAAGKMLLNNASKREIKLYPREKALQEIEKAKEADIRYVCLGEYGYPPLLENIVSPPPVIAIKGRADILDSPCISIVGTRRASAPAIKFTKIITAELAEAGFIIVSGMARGIDSTAHLASLQNGTIAVLAGGADIIYPPEKAELYHAITEKGMIISEMPLGVHATNQNFPRRNRIIAGISIATIVVEATLRSGSIITANYALEHNRDIFAVPGFPLEPRAAGVNKLIMDGAHPLTKTQDVIDVLQPIMRLYQKGGADHLADFWQTKNPQQLLSLDDDCILPKIQNEIDQQNQNQQPDQSQEEKTDLQKIKNLIGYTPVKIAEIIRISELETKTVQSLLMELVLEGEIVQDERSSYVRK